MSKRKTITEYLNEEIQEVNTGVAAINDTTESTETVYSSGKVAELISAIELLPGPQGPAGATGATGAQGNPGSNASVTKENVEAVLTGNITSHFHSAIPVLQIDDSMCPYQMINTDNYIYCMYIRNDSQVINLLEFTEAVGRFIYIHITRLDLPYNLTIQDSSSSYELILDNADEGKMLTFLAFNNDAFAGYKLVSVYPVGGSAASDVVYDATTWDGNTDAPTKNAIRDKFESLSFLPTNSFSGLSKITVGTTEPVAPNANDIWIDTN